MLPFVTLCRSHALAFVGAVPLRLGPGAVAAARRHAAAEAAPVVLNTSVLASQGMEKGAPKTAAAHRARHHQNAARVGQAEEGD